MSRFLNSVDICMIVKVIVFSLIGNRRSFHLADFR